MTSLDDSAMGYRITVEPGFLRAELFNRETVEETRGFLQAVVRYSTRYSSILIQVRSSKPIFQVEQHGFIEYFEKLAQSPSHRIALVADTMDLQASHEYLELLTRQRGWNVRTFRSEAAALHWLTDQRRQPDPRQQPDRRQFQGPRPPQDRRQLKDRRQLEGRRRT